MDTGEAGIEDRDLERKGADGVADEPADGGGQSLGTTAARGFLWANLGIFTRYAFALVLAGLLARKLTAEQYSVMVALTVIMMYTDTALDLGMGAALVYEQEKGITRRVKVAFTANVALAICLAALTVLIAPVIAGFFHLSDYVSVFRAFAIIVMIKGLTTVPWSLFTRGMEFRKRAITELSRDFTYFFSTITLVVAGYGAWGVIVGLILGNTVWMVMAWAFTRFKPVVVWDRVIVRELGSYAWKRAGNSMLGLLALNGDYFVVGSRNPGQLNYYYQAFRLPEFVMGGQLNAMSAVLFPMFSRIRSKGPEALREAMLKALRMVGLFSIPVGVGLALVARDAVLLMFGQANSMTVQTMEVISITGCVVGLGFATGDLLFATNRPGVMLRLNAVMVPPMLGAMWLVAPLGIVWVAVVHFITAVVFTSIRQLIVNRMTGATALQTLRAVVPGATVAACVVLVALPVRLLTSGGIAALLAISAAGVLGGALGLAISPSARFEVRDIVAKARG